MAEEWRPIVREQPMDWPKVVFEQIIKVNNAEVINYPTEVEKLTDILNPYWENDKDWEKLIKKIEDNYKEGIRDIHEPPSPSDKDRISHAIYERSRAIFRASMRLIHDSTGLLPHKEVEGVISEYRPDETALQKTA